MKRRQPNGVTSPAVWHSAMVADRLSRAEHLRLPSGATILAVKPEPLEWILSGRIPQHLLGTALQTIPAAPECADRAITREEILELARFARQLVKASVVKPAIGEGPGEIALDDIPVEDRAFIFEWACRALGKSPDTENRNSKIETRTSQIDDRQSTLGNRRSAIREREDLSSEKLERFRKE